MSTGAPLIEVDALHKDYTVGGKPLPILKGVSFDITSGELVSVMGSSGSGKSTLMNILGLLDHPTQGRYKFGGRDVAALSEPELARVRNQQIGFVFQQFNLLPRLSARDNVALPLLYRGSARRDALSRADAILADLAMAERRHHQPSELSGGQQQRVAIARAIVGAPNVLLADEPTGALDSRVGQEIIDLFVQLNRDAGTTVLLITHDAGVAQQCERRLLMRDGLLLADDR